MHINMKYYIVTIGAIFIALGIGILVGFNLNYDQELSKQQSQVISDLDKRFESLKETNDSLENRVAVLVEDYDNAIQFINQNTDKIIENSLTEKNIGIISTNENNDYTKEINDIITKSNGNISFEIVINDKIEDQSKLEEISNKLGLEIKSTDDAINYIVECLKSEGASEKLAYLGEIGIIKVNSLALDYLSYESVVLTGGSESKDRKELYEKIDKLLIPKLKEENKYIVGVQKTDVKFSYIDLYKVDKITTIDNVDEGIGTISLALALQEGKTIGSYGRLENAECLIPYKK